MGYKFASKIQNIVTIGYKTTKTMDKPTPIVKIKADVEYMPPENFEPPELKLIVTDDAPSHQFCPHDQIKIYPHHRLIQCSNCKATLDPFDHLLMVGRKEGNQLSNITYLTYRLKALNEDIEKLKKQIQKLRKERNSLEKNQ